MQIDAFNSIRIDSSIEVTRTDGQGNELKYLQEQYGCDSRISKFLAAFFLTLVSMCFGLFSRNIRNLWSEFAYGISSKCFKVIKPNLETINIEFNLFKKYTDSPAIQTMESRINQLNQIYSWEESSVSIEVLNRDIEEKNQEMLKRQDEFLSTLKLETTAMMITAIPFSEEEQDKLRHEFDQLKNDQIDKKGNLDAFIQKIKNEEVEGNISRLFTKSQLERAVQSKKTLVKDNIEYAILQPTRDDQFTVLKLHVDEYDKLGEGSYSIAFKVRDYVTNQFLALKVPKTEGEFKYEFCEAEIQREIHNLKILNKNGENVGLQGMPIEMNITLSSGDQLVGYLGRLYSQGDLDTRIGDHTYFNKKQHLDGCKMLMNALSKSLKSNFHHGDIKPQNIFIDENDELFIADWSSAIVMNNDPNSEVTTTDFMLISCCTQDYWDQAARSRQLELAKAAAEKFGMKMNVNERNEMIKLNQYQDFFAIRKTLKETYFGRIQRDPDYADTLIISNQVPNKEVCQIFKDMNAITMHNFKYECIDEFTERWAKIV